MTDTGLTFYAELENTWAELAGAVKTLTDMSPENKETETPNHNQ